MITEQLRRALDEQIADFQKYHDTKSVDKIAFETMDGADCLRVCIRAYEGRRASEEHFVDGGYKPSETGYSNNNEVRFALLMLAAEKSIKYLGHNRKPSILDRLLPYLLAG